MLRPDTPAKVVQAKMAQQLNASLTSAGDALLGFRTTEPEEAKKTLWQESLKLQRRVVVDLTELFELQRSLDSQL